MLQKPLPQDADFPASREHGAVDNFGHFLEVRYYVDVLKRRAFAFTVPFLLILAIGIPIIATRPAIYRVEGKILVDAPQVSSALLPAINTERTTERIFLIEQRILTRDNLLMVADKFKVFGSQQGSLPAESIVALMRARAQIKPTEDTLPNVQTMAFTVGFEHEQPAVALQVANELITLMLDEDIRARTNSASETARLLERETAKLERELSALEVRTAEFKQRNADRGSQAAPQSAEAQLAALKAELAQKAPIYSNSHPDIKALKQKIAATEAAMEGAIDAGGESTPEASIDAFERQEASLRKILEAENQRLAAARIGESLERGQRFERLEVIEQPALPSTPVKPNRPRLFLALFGLALLGGIAPIFLLEYRDDTIRRVSTLVRLIEPQLVVGIPSIKTPAEVSQRRRRAILLTAVVAASGLAGAAAALILPTDNLLEPVLAAFRLS